MTAETAVAALHAAGLTVAAAESLTGGMVCAALSEAPGSSEVFLGGAVTYAVAAKAELLSVPQDLLDRVGPVHPDVARLLARNVAQATGADLGVSTTGVAGPEPHGGHDPGFAYVGWWTSSAAGVIEAQIAGDRAAVKAGITEVALQVVASCAATGGARASELSVPGTFADRE